MKKLRPIVQVVFLGAFLFSMYLGKAQFWMGLIFISIVLSGYLGRFYCGWICPINTLMRPISFISKKLGLQKKVVPSIFKSELPRRIVFGFFLIGLGYTIYTITQGRKFPLPLIIIPLGLLTTIFINEKTWHRYLCPWGVLFGVTGRFAKLGLEVNGCTNCASCVKVCPGDAVALVKNQPAVVDTQHCLLCLDCQSSCPTNALSYTKRSNKDPEITKYNFPVAK